MEPLANSSPRASPGHSTEDISSWHSEAVEMVNGGDSSDSDSLGEEVLNDFQSLMGDARDMSRSMTSLDGFGSATVSPDKVKVLASCIQDLDQQKEVLFSTISKIECNSTLRALAMGRKLTAANLAIKDLQEKSSQDADSIASADKEIEALRSDVESLLTILSTAFCDGEWECLDGELNTVDMERLPGKNGALSVEGLQVLKLQTKLSEQKSELEAYRHEVTRLRDQQTADLEQQFVQLQDELSSCRSQGEGLHSQLSTREAELQRLNNEMTQLTQELTEKDQDSAGNLALIQKLQSQYESCLGETTKLKSTIEELEPQVTCLTTDVTRLEKELAASQCSSHLAQEQVENLRHDLEVVETSAARDVCSWQEEVAKRDAALEQLRQELSTCSTQYADSTGKVREREQKISQLELLQAQCTSDILEREKAIAGLEARLSDTEIQAEDKIQSMERRKQDIEEQLHCRDQLLAAVSVELSAIRRHYKDCCEELQRLEDTRQEMSDRCSTIEQDCSSCSERVRDVKSQLTLLDGCPDENSDSVDGMSASLFASLSCPPQDGGVSRVQLPRALETGVEVREAALCDLRAEVDQCQQLYSQVNDRIQERQHYLDAVQPAYQHAESEVESCRSKIETIQQQLDNLRSRESDITAELANKNETLSLLRQEREQQEAIYRSCCEQVQDREQRVTALASQQDDVHAQVSEHIEQIYQLKSRCAELDQADATGAVAATVGSDTKKTDQYLSKMADFEQLIGRGDSVFSTSDEEDLLIGDGEGKAGANSARREILLSAMVQREEALAWLRVHNDALHRLQEKTSADVERRRLRITQLERQLGVVR
ncbi:restin homolog [Sycon ciliatum]|uniref:restin homolog n=1 Tax=Sycon ciliatum TaxID=27933 RepID=UPI0031F6922D